MRSVRRLLGTAANNGLSYLSLDRDEDARTAAGRKPRCARSTKGFWSQVSIGLAADRYARLAFSRRAARSEERRVGKEWRWGGGGAGEEKEERRQRLEGGRERRLMGVWDC